MVFYCSALENLLYLKLELRPNPKARFARSSHCGNPNARFARTLTLSALRALPKKNATRQKPPKIALTRAIGY